MADESNIVGQVEEKVTGKPVPPRDSKTELDYLRSMDTSLQALAQGRTLPSQSMGRIVQPHRNRGPLSGVTDMLGGRPEGVRRGDLGDGFQRAIFESFVGPDFKKQVQGALGQFASDMGLSLRDVPDEIGHQIGTHLMAALKNTGMGKAAFGGVSSLLKKSLGKVQTTYTQGRDEYLKKHPEEARAFAQKQAERQAAKATDESKTAEVAKQAAEQGEQQAQATGEYREYLETIIEKMPGEPPERQQRAEESAKAKDLPQKPAQNETPDIPREHTPDVSNRSELPQVESAQLPDTQIVDTVKNLAQQPSTDVLNVDTAIKDQVVNQATSELKKQAMSMGKDVMGNVAKGGADLAGMAAKSTTALSSTATATAAAGEGMAAAGASAASMGAGAATAGAGMAGAGAALGAVAAAALPVALVVGAAVLAFKAVAPAIEGFKKVLKSLGAAANRDADARKRNLQLANDRIAADLEEMVTRPFEILKAAAESVYATWESNLRVINGTQGYNKADLQSLMGAFASRLRDEGLTSALSGVDITNSLAKVLGSGLSGRVAEEFAYQAAKLSAAVPTQDFYGYASSYASVAANAIKAGASQEQAIAYANSQIESFASSVLYASRQLSGGFSTGLKDAQTLFDQSVQIAQASKTGVPSQIAGVMTAVAAITGSIAPDLASSMTDVIAKAATGGNDSSLVALRSLAGINASNTEFLKQVATNPQRVFSTLFSNLANMQNMANGAYMEVAEGLSSVFGVSMDAFARVDFNYLAKAIASMNTSSQSLSENMANLASGETTTNAETLKMQQINKYMIDEGLAYVMDNEAARAIQEHMWVEQQTRELKDAEYSVNIRGAALEFLEGIRKTIENLWNFFHLRKYVRKLADNVIGSVVEMDARDKDLAAVLELGKVGAGNQQALQQLMTRNQDLHVTPDLVTVMGGLSRYDIVSSIREGFVYNNSMSNLVWDQAAKAISNLSAASKVSGTNSPATSSYNWGIVGKSLSAAISKTKIGIDHAGISALQTLSTSTSASVAPSLLPNLQRMITDLGDKVDSVDWSDKKAVKEFERETTFKKWLKDANQYGISDMDRALSDAGLTKTQLENIFEEAMASGTQQKQEAEKDKAEADLEKFRTELLKSTGDITTNTQLMIDLITTGNATMVSTQKKLTSFYDKWVSYVVNHEAYSKAYSHTDVSAIQRAEKGKSEDAVYALADVLTKNSVDLLDPQMQTNALLAQILKVAAAIMNQNNSTGGGGLSLPDTLSGLAVGVVKRT